MAWSAALALVLAAHAWLLTSERPWRPAREKLEPTRLVLTSSLAAARKPQLAPELAIALSPVRRPGASVLHSAPRALPPDLAGELAVASTSSGSEIAATNEGFAGAGYVSRPQLTAAPTALVPVPLEWPAGAVPSGSYRGVLKLFIDETGHVQRVHIEDEDDLPVPLAEAARQAFQTTPFIPGEVDGQKVRSWIRVEVLFEEMPVLQARSDPH